MKLLFLGIALLSCLLSNAQADEFVNALNAQQYDKAIEAIDKPIQSQLSADQLQEVMKTQEKLNGELLGYQLNCVDSSKTGAIFMYYTFAFTKSLLDLQVAVNTSTDRVIGFYFVPVQNCSNQYKTPQYKGDHTPIDSSLITAEGDGIKVLLTYPQHTEFKKLVILVPGSGPNDIDGGAGKTKIFKDLAIGLARQGIATIRFKKFQRIKDPQNLRFEDEYLKDIHEILRYSKANFQDVSIYLLGHSLGGMAISHYGSNEVSGLIYMSCNFGGLDSALYRQAHYISVLDDSIDAKEQAMLETIETQVALLNSKQMEDLPNQVVLGIPLSYWRSMKAIDLNRLMEHNVNTPKLFLQGGRDYQVIRKDFDRWMDAVQDHPQVKFMYYEKLNHVYTRGSAQPSPADYEKAGNVPQQVILDIVNFID